MLLRFPGRPINVSHKSIARLERIETLVRKQRRDGAAMLVMMRSAAGDFEERLAAVGQQIALLDAWH